MFKAVSSLESMVNWASFLPSNLKPFESAVPLGAATISVPTLFWAKVLSAWVMVIPKFLGEAPTREERPGTRPATLNPARATMRRRTSIEPKNLIIRIFYYWF